ncbi:MAG: hypothetical protein ACRCWS_04790 [Propionibacteriaceae bacterium]
MSDGAVPENHALSVRQGFALAVASTAPWYSLIVTAPLMVALVGTGAPLAFALAAIPSWLVAIGMNANDRRDPDKGTVYVWVRGKFARLGWFAGFALAATGIIATAGMAYTAADLLWAGAPVVVKVMLGIGLMILAAFIDLRALTIMARLQELAVVAGMAALGWAGWLLGSGQLHLAPVTGTVGDWFHAVLLAVFCYWGFDSIFALTEHTDTGAPAKVASLTMLFVVLLYGLGGLALASSDPEILTDSWLVKAAVLLSAVMSLGSTLIPTARGIESMADAGEMPRWLDRVRQTREATIFVTVIAITWMAWIVIAPGVFDDTIEALSVFVGVYFTASSAIAAAHAERRADALLQWLAAALMVLITVAVGVQMFSPGYGKTAVGGVGGVGVIVGVLLVIGVFGAALYGRHGAAAAKAARQAARIRER